MTEPLPPADQTPEQAPVAGAQQSLWHRKPMVFAVAGIGVIAIIAATVTATLAATRGTPAACHPRHTAIAQPVAAASTYAAPATSAPPPTTAPPPAPAPPSCSQQVADWKGSPGAQALSQAATVMQSISTDGQSGDFSAVAGDLDQLGAVATTMQGNPVPHCADRHHYWRKMTVAMLAAAAQSTGVGNADTTALQQAMNATSQFSADADALISEIKGEGLW